MSFVVPRDIVSASRTTTTSLPQHAAKTSPRKLSFLRYAAAALLVLVGSGIAWAGIGLSFGGVTQPINTGTISLSAPAGVVVDTAGDVYIADTGHSQIVVVNPQGVASVLTINGLTLSSPKGLALDGSGNLYIADSGNSRIAKVDASGNGTVISMGTVTLAAPAGVALDQLGDLFIADTGNSRIVEVPAGGSAAPLAITGVVPTSPVGLAVDTKGNLYIVDVSGSRVITVAATTTVGVLLTISGGVTLNAPTAVAVDSFGNVFIADTGNHRIAEVDTSGNGNVLQTVAIELDLPEAVAVDVFGAIYIADAGGNQAVVADQQFTPSVVSGSPGYSLNRTAVGFGHIQLGSTTPVTLTLHFSIGAAPVLGAVSVYTSGAPNLDFKVTTGASACTSGFASGLCNVYVQFLPTAPGLRSGAVVLYDSATPANPILTIPLYGFGDSPVATLSPGTASLASLGGATLNAPFQIAFDPAGDMYVANYGEVAGNVVKVPAGGGSATVVSTGGFTLAGAIGVVLDGAGNLYISDHDNNRVLVVSPAGSVSLLTINGLGSTGLNLPCALALDAAGNLYIADYGRGRIVKVAPSGFGSVLATKGFTFPQVSVLGVAVDTAGTVYIPDSSGNRVVKVTASGAASLVVPAGITPALSSPQGVAVDAFGNLYIADGGNRRIVEITTGGIASVVQMPGQTLVTDYGVTVDLSGNVFIPDFSANHIVKVNVSGATLPAFPNTNVGASSITQAATVTNLGNQPLVFSTNPTFTANFSQPAGSTNQCLSGTSLTGGLACNVSVQFTPQSVGSLSAGIMVTDNTLNVADSTQQLSVSGTGISPGDTTATAVVTIPTSANIGQALAITATVTDTTPGHTTTVPTGGVTLMDTVGSTTVSLNNGSVVALVAGVATLTGVVLSGAGTHTITANYAGVSGTFLTSSNTTTLTLSKTPVVVTGPVTQPIHVVNGQSGSVPITVAGPYSGLAVPTGSVNYSVLNASNTSVASGAATLTGASTNSTTTVPIANTLAAGAYTVTASYGGDTNYAASATATTIQILVGQITPTISWTLSATTIGAGTSLTGLLTATAVSGESTIPGAFSYTATLQGGSPVAVTNATVLNPGSYTLTAIFTPTDSVTYMSVSASVALTVQDFQLNIATGGPTTATVVPGGTATYALTIGPTGGLTFPAPVTLSLSGLPPGATGTLTPSTIAAGAGLTPVALSVQLPSSTAALHRSDTLAREMSPLMLGMLLLPFGGKIRRVFGSPLRKQQMVLLLLTGIALLGFTGCGVKTGFFGNPPTTYTLTVTATSGTLSHSTTLTLTVQ
jgi:sugar lactone lactonase YvrE